MISSLHSPATSSGNNATMTHPDKRPSDEKSSSEEELSSSKRKHKKQAQSSSTAIPSIGGASSSSSHPGISLSSLRSSTTSSTSSLSAGISSRTHETVNCQSAPSAVSTNIDFDPSFSDHYSFEEVEYDHDNDDHLFDGGELLTEIATTLSDTSLTPSTSISQQQGTLKKIPSE